MTAKNTNAHYRLFVPHFRKMVRERNASEDVYDLNVNYALNHIKLFLNEEEVKGKRVLDAGCGWGLNTNALALMGPAEVAGIDISDDGLQMARSESERRGNLNTRFVECDLVNGDLPEGSFDIVFCWGVICHTANPLKTLENLKRWLKPGGILVVAFYKRALTTPFHDLTRKIACSLPSRTWLPLSYLIHWLFFPVFHFTRHRKMRLCHPVALIHDWFFVPIRTHYHPEEILPRLKGWFLLEFIPRTARFDFSSQFIFKVRKPVGDQS